MSVFKDQTGRTITLPGIPQRIISLVPSQTELLHHLGLADQVTGITKFCVHPESWFRTKTRVGGTKQLNMGIIHTLAPDLIIANKEENVKEQIEELSKQYAVWVSDVNNLTDACNMILQIGELTGKATAANQLHTQIINKFSELQKDHNELKTAYLIWNNPYMAASSNTFIHSMLSAAGFKNVFAQKQRYPVVTIEELQASGCELLLLSSEPFPFKQKHIDELQRYLPATRILLADGELFSWYGSRLLHAPGYFQALKNKASQYL